MVLRMEVGSLTFLEAAMRSMYGRIFAKKRCSCWKTARLRLATGAKLDFGMMFGVEKPIFALLSPSCMKWLVLKGLRW